MTDDAGRSDATGDAVESPDFLDFPDSRDSMNGPEIRTLDSRVVYRNRWISVREDRIRRVDGSEGIYSVVDRTDFALIIPESDGGCHLVEQYRYPVRQRCWEFPQGTSERDPDTPPADLARAELAEETGLRAGRVEHIGYTHAANGLSSQGCHVFLATDLVAGDSALEPEEVGLVTAWFAWDEVWAMIDAGRLRDAHTLAALTLLDRHRRRAAR